MQAWQIRLLASILLLNNHKKTKFPSYTGNFRELSTDYKMLKYIYQIQILSLCLETASVIIEDTHQSPQVVVTIWIFFSVFDSS